MDCDLKTRIDAHVHFCNNMLSKHINMLIELYEKEIEPIEALVKQDSSHEVTAFIEAIEDIRDSAREEEEQE